MRRRWMGFLYGVMGAIVWHAEADAQWTRADGTTPGYEAINPAGQFALETKIRLDSNGNPCVVWEDDFDDIYFSRWNGTTWVKADGVTPGSDNLSASPGESWLPRFELDGDDNPCVVWSEFSGGQMCIYFTRWNGSAWVRADGGTPGSDCVVATGGFADASLIVLDGDGRPTIAWSHDSRVAFSRWNGAMWTRADGATAGYDLVGDPEGFPCPEAFSLDSEGRPWLVWADFSFGEIFVSRWNGTAWTHADGVTRGYENISLTPGDSDWPQMELDGESRPSVAWRDWSQGNSKLCFTRWNGEDWTRADMITSGHDEVSTGVETVGDAPRLKLIDDGTPCLAWKGITGAEGGVYFSLWNGISWTGANRMTLHYDRVANGITVDCPHLMVDTFGKPSLAWLGPSPDYDLCFSRFNGSSWTKADGVTLGYDNITHGTAAGSWSDWTFFQLDPAGRPRMAWAGSAGGGSDVLYAQWSGAVNNAPVAVIDLCSVSGQTVSFRGGRSYDTDAGDGIVQYVWDFGDGSRPCFVTDPVHAFPTNGLFTVTLTVWDHHMTWGSAVKRIQLRVLEESTTAVRGSGGPAVNRPKGMSSP